MQKHNKKAQEAQFEDSIQVGVVSGMLQFSNKYCSKFDLYLALSEWSNEDENLIYSGIRTSSNDFINVDFRYNESKTPSKLQAKSFLYDYLKPLFEKKLGGDYLQAWNMDRETIIVK